MKQNFFKNHKKTIKGLVLTLLFIFVSPVYGSGASNQKAKSIKDVKVSLNITSSNVESILKSVEAKTKFIFVYDKEDLKNDVILKTPGEPVSVYKLLKTISDNTSLRFKQRDNNIIVKLEKKDVVSKEKLDKTITGIVTNEDGLPMPGATILAKGTSIGVEADFDGNYSITVPDDTEFLVFSYVGYITKEVAISGKQVIDHQFTVDKNSLDEVIVIGYGTQKKSDVVGSVGSVDESRLKDVPNTNFAQALQGSVAGVYIRNNSAGAEQGDVGIRIRGQNSITANNQPLIVLDGSPFSGGISQINPDDIASIEVLKDVSASAIYGTRGANGIILITTKKGKIGKPVFTYSSQIGFQSPANVPNFMNGEEFYNFKLTRNGSDNPIDVFSQTELDNFNAGIETDWVDATTRTGIRTQHAISVSSGTENSKVYFSGTFLDVEGIAKNDNFKRYNIQLNVNQKINDWLSLGTNTRLGYSDRSGIGVRLDQAFRMNPLTTPFDQNGNISVYPWPEDQFFGNPLAPLLYQSEDDEYGVFSNVYADVKLNFVPGLAYRINTSYEYTGRTINNYRGRNTKIGLEAVPNQSNPLNPERAGVATNRQQKRRNYLIENILTYKRNFGKHDIDFTGLYSLQREDFQRFDYVARGFVNDILTFYQADGTTNITTINRFTDRVLLSQMGRLQYGYDNKYRVTMTVRRDGFSGFGTDDKYTVFPSVGAAWTISNEKFLEDSSVISNLKLRVSHGEIGNQAIDSYETFSQFESQNYINNDGGATLATGYFPSSLGDPSLGWETTVSSNIGLDFGFFKNRLTGSVEYYVSDTEDLLLNRRISLIQGIPTILQNVGAVNNKGLEIFLAGDIVRSENFNWTANLNFSYNRNEITRLTTGDDDVANRRFIGQPINVNFGYAFDGVWQEDEATEAAAFNAVPGDVKVLDLNPEDGEGITDDDRIIQGSLQPDFIAGFGSTITYKNFGLNFFFYTEQGLERANGLLATNDFLVDRFNGVKRTFWTPENPINTYPRNNVNANPRGVAFYEDASFIRLRDITLSYNLPKSLLDGIGLKEFRVYTTARNLFTITDWSGTDPEFPNQFGVPLERSFVFGLNLSF